MKKFNIQWSNERTAFILRLLLAIFVTLALFVGAYSFTYITYTTTDDVALMQKLAGCFNNEPMSWVSFISPILCWFVAFLYRLFPQQPCYVYLQIILMYISIATINYCLLKHCSKYRLGIVKGLVLAILLFVGVFGWVLVRMHFYYVALLASVSAIALILTMDFKDRKWIFPGIFALLQIVVSLLYSLDTSYAVLCFVALALVYRSIMAIISKCGKKVVLVSVVFVIFTFATILGFKALLRYDRVRVNGQDYVEWNSYRVSYWDYEVTPYEENPELYEDVGWNEEFFKLTRKLYFMDEKFQTEQLSQLVNKFSRTDFPTSERSLQDAIVTAKELNSSSPVANGLFDLLLNLFVLSLFAIRFNKKQLLRLLASICSVGGAGILCFYLCLRGRFPLRAFVPIAIPCIIFLIFNLVDLWHEFWSYRKHNGQYSAKETPALGNRKFFIVLRGVILGISVAVTLISFYRSTTQITGYLKDPEKEQYYLELHERENLVYDYVKSDKDSIYIFDWSMLPTYNPFSDVSCGDLNNLFCWGGARMHAYAFEDQLRINGREDLYSDAFLEDDIYLLSNSNSNIMLLLKYLTKEYGGGTCVITQMLDQNIKVCKYLPGVQKDALARYDGASMFVCEDGITRQYILASDGVTLIQK